MRQRKVTKDNIRVISDIAPSLAQKLDEECRQMGNCARAVIIRLALMERYRETTEAPRSAQ